MIHNNNYAGIFFALRDDSKDYKRKGRCSHSRILSRDSSRTQRLINKNIEYGIVSKRLSSKKNKHGRTVIDARENAALRVRRSYPSRRPARRILAADRAGWLLFAPFRRVRTAATTIARRCVNRCLIRSRRPLPTISRQLSNSARARRGTRN